MILNQNSNPSVQKTLVLFLSLLLGASLLSACGFKLRGAYLLPAAMQTTYIDSSQVSVDLTRVVKNALRDSDIKITEENSADVAVLKLYKEVKGKRIASVDANGRARELTLSYALSFSLVAKQQEFEITEQTIKIDRDFLFDPEDVLGNSRGEDQLYKEMQQDLVRLLLLRLQSKA